HFSVSEALALNARVKPRRAVLSNLHTDVDYAQLASEVPPGVVPAFDGMRIESETERANIRDKGAEN
ncbi:MAG: hypothetical protein ACJ8DG_18485, partial [Microvirga sp.]